MSQVSERDISNEISEEEKKYVKVMKKKIMKK